MKTQVELLPLRVTATQSAWKFQEDQDQDQDQDPEVDGDSDSSARREMPHPPDPTTGRGGWGGRGEEVIRLTRKLSPRSVLDTSRSGSSPTRAGD